MKRRASTESGVASMFTGIASLQMWFLFPFFPSPFIFGVLALAYGHESWSKNKDGLGFVGLILGLITLILTVYFLIVGLVSVSLG